MSVRLHRQIIWRKILAGEAAVHPARHPEVRVST